MMYLDSNINGNLLFSNKRHGHEIMCNVANNIVGLGLQSLGYQVSRTIHSHKVEQVCSRIHNPSCLYFFPYT